MSNFMIKLRKLSSRMTATSALVALTATSGSILASTAANAGSHSVAGDQYAVVLMEMWVESGAPNGEFEYTDTSGNMQIANFDDDILPMFTMDGYWAHDEDGMFDTDGEESAISCAGCHGSTEDDRADSEHEMNVGSYEGLMGGADALSKPPGVGLFGESVIGAADYDWKNSKMKGRLRNNRMPAGMINDHTEENRDGPCLLNGALVANDKYICDAGEENAVNVLAAWVNSGAENNEHFDNVILPMFTTGEYWAPDTLACSDCHGSTEEDRADSEHEMNVGSYAGLMGGADALSKPPGVGLFGESVIGAADYDWGHSKMKGRLRNNRMPAGIINDHTEENRDGPLVNPLN